MIGEPCSFHLYNNLKFEISDISHLLNRGDSYMLLNDNNNLIKKVTFFYDSKNTNMAGPPSSQSELSYEHTYTLHYGLSYNCYFQCFGYRNMLVDYQSYYGNHCHWVY